MQYWRQIRKDRRRSVELLRDGMKAVAILQTFLGGASRTESGRFRPTRRLRTPAYPHICPIQNCPITAKMSAGFWPRNVRRLIGWADFRLKMSLRRIYVPKIAMNYRKSLRIWRDSVARSNSEARARIELEQRQWTQTRGTWADMLSSEARKWQHAK